MEVHVCQGTYTEEALVLDYPLSLLGGYDCGSFKKANGGTLIADGNKGANRTALTVRGAALTRAISISGLTIRPTNADQFIDPVVTTVAIAVRDGASPTLRNLAIEGGRSPDRMGLAIGIDISDASPEIADVSVLGGIGTQEVIGVRIAGGAPFIHDSKVIGGSEAVGPDAAGTAYGAFIEGAHSSDAEPWHDVTFTAGAARRGGVALRIASSTRFAMSAASVLGPTTYAGSASGIEAVDTEVELTRSRVASGSPAVNGNVPVAAIDATRSPLVLTNSVIVATGVLDADVTGVAVRGAPARIVHNTLLFYIGPGAGIGAAQSGVRVTQGATGVDIIDNLMLANSAIYLRGVRLDGACDGFAASRLGDVRANAFVQMGQALDFYDGGPACTSTLAPSYLSVAEAALAPHAAGLVAGNVELVDDCTGDPSAACRTCSRPNCQSSIIVPWTQLNSPSSAELLSSPGYSFAPAVPCVLATGGIVTNPPVPVDVHGSARGTKPSIGAWEAQAGAFCSP